MKDWIEFEKEKPGHEVVLGACDTYDCGWVMDTVWWSPSTNQWMTTGSVESLPAHLEYSHWRKLPEPPTEFEVINIETPKSQEFIKEKLSFIEKLKSLWKR
jgi:hypothetical protein